MLPPEDFDELVERAFQRIPRPFRKRLENVAILVDAEPSPEQLRRARVGRGSTLFGLYEGHPLPHRSFADPFRMPDRITIFQGPHERAARNMHHLETLIADTLWHEVAHYFGMDERQVRAAEHRRMRRQQ